jgi:hypothetical protein
LSARTLAPYVFISGCSGLVVILQADAGAANGYYYLAIATSLAYALLVCVAVIQDIAETRAAEESIEGVRAAAVA